MSIAETLRECRESWQKYREKYGNHRYVDDVQELEGIDSKRIWTEFWRTDQFITNEFIYQEELDGDITGYYLFDKPYEEEPGSVTLFTTLWVDCESCNGEDPGCNECEGDGTVPLDVL